MFSENDMGFTSPIDGGTWEKFLRIKYFGAFSCLLLFFFFETGFSV